MPILIISMDLAIKISDLSSREEILRVILEFFWNYLTDCLRMRFMKILSIGDSTENQS
ncbi:hypothetical protein ES703_35276 [subsurface metagenome]